MTDTSIPPDPEDDAPVAPAPEPTSEPVAPNPFASDAPPAPKPEAVQSDPASVPATGETVNPAHWTSEGVETLPPTDGASFDERVRKIVSEVIDDVKDWARKQFGGSAGTPS
jgi:hypothetical protein